MQHVAELKLLGSEKAYWSVVNEKVQLSDALESSEKVIKRVTIERDYFRTENEKLKIDNNVLADQLNKNKSVRRRKRSVPTATTRQTTCAAWRRLRGLHPWGYHQLHDAHGFP